jgi:hypothetical protein
MTLRGPGVECDHCHALVSPAVDPERWETLSGGEMHDAHLCPKCSARREELASNPLGLRCARCGRTPPEVRDWRQGQSDGEPLTCCVDCFNEEEDGIVI